MSTHSQIGIKNLDGSIETIYCHWDGHVFTNGKTLVNHYTTEDKVRELISLGSLSSLHERIKPNKDEKHSFDNPSEDVTVAYIRDRNEHSENCQSKKYKNFKDYKKGLKYLDGEYHYLYNVKTSKWICLKPVYQLSKDFTYRYISLGKYKE